MSAFYGPEHLPRCLRALRLRAGLSQNGLARLAAIDVAYVSRLEAGLQGTPSRRTVDCLASALDLNELEREHLLHAAGLATSQDWIARALKAEAQLAALRATLKP